MTGRSAVSLAGLVAVLLLAAATDPPRPAPIRITFVSSPEKAALLRPIVAQFNSGRQSLVGGRRVVVSLQIVNSGDAETSIVSGALRPTVWSPASSLWGRLLNFQAGRELVPARNPSIVKTPLVIAMWEPMARALGWPRPISFRRIMDLATSRRGWAAVGHPEFGPFRLGHTDPDVSTSGLSAVVAEYYAETGNRGGVDTRAITRPDVRRRVRAVERSVVRYGDTTLSFAKQLERYGPTYASAVAMEETTLYQVNHDAKRTPRLQAIYPADGTFFSDSPYIVPRAPWVSARQRAAAAAFERALDKAVTSELAERYGFRISSAPSLYTTPDDTANGVDPRQPAHQLPLPKPNVLAAIRSDWRTNRRPANVILAVDTSDAMRAGGKFPAVQRALQAFTNVLSPRDRVGVVSYSDQPFVEAPPVRLDRPGRDRVRAALRQLEPGGQSALYDATATAVREARRLHDADRINAVVLLDAGGDNRSAMNAAGLIAALTRQARAQGGGVAVYPIALGRGANSRVLNQIAGASHGYPYTAQPDTLEATYRTIASYF